MKDKKKNSIALAVVLLFYIAAIVQKLSLSIKEIFVEQFLGLYMLLSILGISSILLANKYILKNTFSVFAGKERNMLKDIALAFLLIGFIYFVYSLGNISYFRWIKTEIDQTAITKLLNKIFSNHLHAVIFIGPFNWLNEAFAALSIVFILNNLWALGLKKRWIWGAIGIVAVLFSLIQLDKGLPSMIHTFIIVFAALSIYYSYRSIYPLFIAEISMQTIDLVSYWIYNT